MEALSLTGPVHSHLLRQKQQEFTSRNLNGTYSRKNVLSFKPFIAATLSKPTAEISSKPLSSSPSSSSSVTVSQNDSSDSSSASPPTKRVSPHSLKYPSGYLGAVPDRTVPDGSNGIIDAMGYLTNILVSKAYDVAIESPLELAPKLSQQLGVKIWLKREDMQPVSISILFFLGCINVCII